MYGNVWLFVDLCSPDCHKSEKKNIKLEGTYFSEKLKLKKNILIQFFSENWEKFTSKRWLISFSIFLSDIASGCLRMWFILNDRIDIE